jgi:peptidoglycan/LPS O-acetylase OafA/YrhL
MILAVLQAMGVVCYALVAIPLAVISYLIAATPIGGAPTTAPTGLAEAVIKSTFYAVIAALAVAPLALGNQGWYAAMLASRPMVWLGEISYEIFLVHLLTMEFAMVELVRYRIYTGSMTVLFVMTLVITIPPAWLLHRVTRVR